MPRLILCLVSLCCFTCVARAQPAPEAELPAQAAPGLPEHGAPHSPAASADAPAPNAAEADADAGAEPAPPAAEADEKPAAELRGDTPISAQEIAGEPAPTAPPAEDPSPTPEPEPAPLPEPAPPPGNLVVWATADWGSTFGSARCQAEGVAGDAASLVPNLEASEAALRVASTLKDSVAIAGVGLATGGTLGSHPLLEYAGQKQPEALAALLSSAGFEAIALGLADLTGPLFRASGLGAALAQHGVRVIASNLVCGGQAYCEHWDTDEKPLSIVERDGRRYALLALLPDDSLERVQPVLGEQLQLQPMLEAMQRRMEEAHAAGVDLAVAILDHGPDSSAVVKLATFVAALPAQARPDLLLSPSAGENLLMLRPLDVLPAIVGTRRAVLTGMRVTRLDERDTNVVARSVRPAAEHHELAARFSALLRDFCAAGGASLQGAHFEQPVSASDFVGLAAAAARQLAGADLALVDPRAFEPSLAFPAGVQLERAQVERAVPFDAPLVVASVPLAWLMQLRGMLEGERPLTLIGVEQQNLDTLIAGRLAIPGAHYRIVTTSVLARSQRLPAGAEFRPLKAPNASLRGALLTLLGTPAQRDPRSRLRDPALGTQWVTRIDGQLLTNLTAVRGRGMYDDPALSADDSRQVGGRLVLNADADAPHFLFENMLQVAFDRNFATRTTAQDLNFAQITYTYRGLWGKPLLYPHPFVEGYVEASFLRPEDAAYHHLMLRPRAGLRSIFTRVFSLKVSGGAHYEVFAPQRPLSPGLSAELLLKPWTIMSKNGPLQFEGNILYYWDSPTSRDEHMLRAQLISAYQLVGPLQVTLSTLAVMRKLPELERGQSISMQLGLRLRFVTRAMLD